MDDVSLRSFEQYLLGHRFAMSAREQLRRAIAERLHHEGLVDQPHFRSIRTAALELMFDYDEHFFQGALRPLVSHRDGSISWRFSSRMTSTGGTTTRREYQPPYPRGYRAEYEIAISSHLLFQGFADPKRPEVVSGVRCVHRTDALQRIFEHELIHLAEMLVWYDSSCAAGRFRQIAERLFGHKESTHRLPRTEDRARKELGIRRGSRVRFDFEGHTYSGVVNRISRRDGLGSGSGRSLYDDGHRYRKFYVPIKLLRRS
ncbi:MAG: hypothetical protein R3B96_24245 [Pirellulaceae bacterium]